MHGPHIRAGPCWEGIWPALLAGRECVCRVHQSLPSPGELNKLIGRLVAASSRHCGPYSSQYCSESSAVKQLKGQRRLQRSCKALAYSLKIHFHILFQHTTKPQILKFTPSSKKMFKIQLWIGRRLGTVGALAGSYSKSKECILHMFFFLHLYIWCGGGVGFGGA